MFTLSETLTTHDTSTLSVHVAGGIVSVSPTLIVIGVVSTVITGASVSG